MVILYQSNTGFTQEYAQMLAKAEKLKCYEQGTGPQPLAGEEVFYMGPLMAGHITGLDQAMKRYSVKGICGVGMSPPGEQVLSTMADNIEMTGKINFPFTCPIRTFGKRFFGSMC